ncbi:MAG: hypothetical protein IT209_02510 [Armatimonadetes bacterium]|nr:hypothetical protein [Armatimonadota bacterium]
MSQAAQARKAESVQSFAQNVKEPEALAHMQDLRKSIVRSNRLWLLAFVAVLAASFFLMWFFGRQDRMMEKRDTERMTSPGTSQSAPSSR